MHWTGAAGGTVRGRRKVLAMLEQPAEQRDLVSSNEAKVALLIAAAAVDANCQDGHLDDFSTEAVMRGLTVAWERISPLSEDVTGGDGTVAESMREYLAAMREARSQFGL